MLLVLLRDRGALLMGFVVPVVFFLILAEIFTSSADGELRLRLALTDEIQSPESLRLLAALEANASIERVDHAGDRETVRELVRRGTADVGLVLRADGEPLTGPPGFGPPPLLLLVDPARAVIADLLTGQLQRAYFGALPDVPLRNVIDLVGSEFTEFTPGQLAEIETGLGGMVRAAEAGAEVGFRFDDLLDRTSVVGQSASRNQVAYYAGAIAFMFLLLAAAQGAMTLIDEHESGILDRIAAGPAGPAPVMDGKFLFLAGQGLVQTTLIFAAAWLIYGVDLPGEWPGFLLVSVAAALCAAGIGLALVALCGTRARAQVMPVVVIVTVSAIGGSMVPRFFMPPWLQDLGWLTPNTWALEAYSGVFWRGAAASELLLPCILLALAGVAGLACARLAVRRMLGD